MLPGLMINTMNPATDYRHGTEFHLDFMVNQFVAKDIAIGIQGSWYKQIDGDSGAGATFGPFMGESFGLGPARAVGARAAQGPLCLHAEVAARLLQHQPPERRLGPGRRCRGGSEGGVQPARRLRLDRPAHPRGERRRRVLSLGSLPGHIAQSRHHPQEQAVRIGGLDHPVPRPSAVAGRADLGLCRRAGAARGRPRDDRRDLQRLSGDPVRAGEAPHRAVQHVLEDLAGDRAAAAAVRPVHPDGLGRAAGTGARDPQLGRDRARRGGRGARGAGRGEHAAQGRRRAVPDRSGAVPGAGRCARPRSSSSRRRASPR